MSQMMQNTNFESLQRKISDRTALIGVIGLGYVGLPLAVAAARSKFTTLGFDIDADKITLLDKGKSYIDAVTNQKLSEVLQENKFRASIEFTELSTCDVIVICVPTPLTRYRDPDLSFVERTVTTIAKTLRAGQLVILESTTYPGTTTEVVKPILESTGLLAGRDFFLGFSPEREDPGNTKFETTTIPKVVSGFGREALILVEGFYSAVVKKVVSVSSPDVAEAVKITENVFRAVNIAMVNELKVIYDAMGIDIWEVIEAAATKPFGYMPFYPGPGLGGHCIPIDPFYLAWRSRGFGYSAKFIELAGEVNASMPLWVVNRVGEALDGRFSVPLTRARLLVVGMAYKKNVADIRESPSLKLIELLEERRAKVDYHDPHVPEVPRTREHPNLTGRRSVPLDQATLRSCQAVIIATDHDAVDYALIAKHASLVVDTRNVFARNQLRGDHIIKC